jgi:hypothetical protein
MANDLAAFKAEVWSKSLIMNLDKINVMTNLVNDDYEGEITGKGSTVKVRTLGNITMGDYSGTITYQDLAPNLESMVISDAKYFAFQVGDIEEAQTDIDALNAYTGRAAISMNDTVEAKLLGNYAAVIAANRITGASSAAIALDKDNIYEYFVKARTALSKANVPNTGRWAVIDPDTTGLLLRAPEFIKATDLGDQVVTSGRIGMDARPGFIGRIAAFDVYESNNVPVAASAKYLQFGDRYFISYAAQISDIEAIRLQTTFATAVRGLLLHDCKVFTEGSKRGAYIKAVA